MVKLKKEKEKKNLIIFKLKITPIPFHLKTKNNTVGKKHLFYWTWEIKKGDDLASKGV